MYLGVKITGKMPNEERTLSIEVSANANLAKEDFAALVRDEDLLKKTFANKEIVKVRFNGEKVSLHTNSDKSRILFDDEPLCEAGIVTIKKVHRLTIGDVEFGVCMVVAD